MDELSRLIFALRLIVSSQNTRISAPARLRLTGDVQHDTLLATALAFALSQHGTEAPDWMLSRPALPREWLWDGGYDAEGPFKEFIRARTPDMFLAKNLLLRERDLVAP